MPIRNGEAIDVVIGLESSSEAGQVHYHIDGGETQVTDRRQSSQKFQISRKTLLENKQKILETAEKSSGCHQKNACQGTYPELEEVLITRLKSKVARKVPVSGGLLKQKAEVRVFQMNIEEFKVSNSWLRA